MDGYPHPEASVRVHLELTRGCTHVVTLTTVGGFHNIESSTPRVVRAKDLGIRYDEHILTQPCKYLKCR